MQLLVDITLIVFGCVGIACGIFGEEFWVGDADGISSFNRRASTGSGRLVFWIAGVMLLAIGVKLILR